MFLTKPKFLIPMAFIAGAFFIGTNYELKPGVTGVPSVLNSGKKYSKVSVTVYEQVTGAQQGSIEVIQSASEFQLQASQTLWNGRILTELSKKGWEQDDDAPVLTGEIRSYNGHAGYMFLCQKKTCGYVEDPIDTESGDPNGSQCLARIGKALDKIK